MAKVLSSISGNLISAASAGYAPTNSADVSAIASAYQVVSATATQLYAGTAYLTEVNGAPVSASRAGNAANASMATSAYYDGTGRLISALPDSAAVSSIASSYAESAASSKLDSTAFSAVSGDFLTAETVSSIATAQYGPQPTDVGVTAINGFGLVAKSAATAYSAIWASIAGTDGNLRELTSLADSAAVSAIASSYAESAASGKADSSDVSGVIDTVSSNSASWGQGGVVTATGSASALTGIWPLTTAYLVSSINGSALLPYGYSALTANSSNWISTRTTVYNNSANWNSVYNTVYSNSASWSGSTGGGSVTSPSGTILVMNGNEIEGTNSAVLTANGGEAFEQLLYPQNYAIGTNMQILAYGNVPDTGATLMMPLENPAYAEIRVILSGRDNDYGYTSASGIIPLGTNTASIPMDGITGEISASADQWFNLVATTLTARKEGGISVTGIGELAWKSAVDDVTNTVSANSATWGQGGIDSATVSAIASSYAESAASSKLDTSAFNSGDFYSTSNPSGFITGVDLTNYATTGYVDSSVSSKLDTTAFNSADFYTTANESGYVDSAYVDSAVSGKMDTSAIDYTRTGDGTQIYASGTGSSTNQFSAKNDSAGAAIIAGENARLRLWDTAATANLYASSIGSWNAASNLVSSQSANWGGSALALSAGPGVSLTMVGNTLVAGLDETVLWSGAGSTTGSTINLSESLENFERYGIYYYIPYGECGPQYIEKCYSAGSTAFNMTTMQCANTLVRCFCDYGSMNETSISLVSGRQAEVWFTGASVDWYDGADRHHTITKVVGINRTAGV